MGQLSTLLAFFTPESGGSPNANEINGLYKVELVIALIIFFAVEGALVYALIRFRKRKGAIPAQIRGNTRLEYSWTIGAAVILVALAGLTFSKLSSIENPPNSGADAYSASEDGQLLYASSQRKLPPNGKALDITVIGRQYIWQYIYPGATEPDGLGAPYSYEEMVVPTETTVSLDIVSAGRRPRLVGPGARRQVPGRSRLPQLHLVQDPQAGGLPRAVRVPLRTAHARMLATVRAVPPAQFEAWLANQKKLLSQADQAAKVAREKLGAQTGAGQVENP